MLGVTFIVMLSAVMLNARMIRVEVLVGNRFLVMKGTVLKAEYTERLEQRYFRQIMSVDIFAAAVKKQTFEFTKFYEQFLDKPLLNLKELYPLKLGNQIKCLNELMNKSLIYYT